MSKHTSDESLSVVNDDGLIAQDAAGDSHSAPPLSSRLTDHDLAVKPRNTVAWFALLLSFIGLITVSILGYLAIQFQQRVISDFSGIKLAQQSQRQQLDFLLKLEQQLQQTEEQLTASIQHQLLEIQQKVKGNVDNLHQKIAELSGRQPSDWGIAEAHYLVRIAGRKLWLENDSQTALHLLVTAEQRIAELGDPALMPIRMAIANDIAVVRGLPQPRVTEIYVHLAGLLEQLDGLPLEYVDQHLQPMEHHVVPQVSGEIKDWQQNLKLSIVTLLNKMFYINTGTEAGASEPFRMPQQQWFLRANVRLAWLQAQTALLQGESVIYQRALQRSFTWLEHFKPSDPKVKATMATLVNLLNEPINVSADYPQGFTSQPLLEQTLRQRLTTEPQIQTLATPTVSSAVMVEQQQEVISSLDDSSRITEQSPAMSVVKSIQQPLFHHSQSQGE